jgi:hypothetical protein
MPTYSDWASNRCVRPAAECLCMPRDREDSGKPDAGNPQVRFEEGGGGADRMAGGYCATNGETLKQK